MTAAEAQVFDDGPAIAAAADPVPSHLIDALCEFDFMKCLKCGRVCTNTEVTAAIEPGGDGAVCPCGSLKYGPYQVAWRDYALPQVIRYARERLGFTDQAVRADLWLETGVERLSFLARCLAVAQLWRAQRSVR